MFKAAEVFRRPVYYKCAMVKQAIHLTNVKTIRHCHGNYQRFIINYL